MKATWWGLAALALTISCSCTGQAPDKDAAGGHGEMPKPTMKPKPRQIKPAEAGEHYLEQTPAAYAAGPRGDYGLGPGHVDKLMPFPMLKPGDRSPLDLWKYAGRGKSSWGSPTMPDFDMWKEKMDAQKPELMKDVQEYMASRFDFSGRTIPGATQSGGKPIMAGPVTRLPKGVESWEGLATMTADEIRDKDLFPFLPLAHPLHSTAHIVFPNDWVDVHPEFQRIDVDHDFPDEYLPEFPPPLFLTTHKELGDVSEGKEITLGNYFEIFDGLLSPEQMEGLERLLRPTPTTWFNQTPHRVTADPSVGVSCLSCHTNGHTNAAFELAPDARPNLARLRVDTPTIRGNFNLMLFSSHRSIRSLDHFAEVEEYFDGDQAMASAIGTRGIQKAISNRMGDFMAIVDNPPAPKLDPLGRLRPDLATEQELQGEKLFWGKAMCSQCHSGPAFVDDYMHDLQVERFYVGRPEGPIKTFPLRGIKDSPPYLHDGRLPTLGDTVEFFNLVLNLQLNKDEKAALVAYMLCL